jgi:hypothetical protein
MLPRRGVRNARSPFEGSDAMRRTDELQRLTTRELCIKYENGTYPETDSMPTMGGPVGQMRFSAATLTEGGSMTLPGTLDVDGGSTLRGVAVFTGAVDIAGQLTTTGLTRLEGTVEIVGPISGSITGNTAAGIRQNLSFGQDYRLLARNVATCAIWYMKGTEYLCLPLLPSTDYDRETTFGDIVPPSGFTGVTASYLVLGPYSQITLTAGTVSYTKDNSTSAPQRFIFPISVNGAALTSNINSGSTDTYRLICSPSMA